MKFHEKLRSRVAELGINKAKAARDAGLPESTISSYMAKAESLPRIDIALKIAKAIKVPLEWLADDAADWPPPQPNLPSLDRADPDDLVFEVCKLQRRELLYLVKALDQAESVNWLEILNELEGWKPGKPMPKKASAVGDICFAASVGPVRIEECEPRMVALKKHAELPGADRPAAEFAPGVIESRFKSLIHKPGFAECAARFRASGAFNAQQAIEQLKKEGTWHPNPQPTIPPSAFREAFDARWYEPS